MLANGFLRQSQLPLDPAPWRETEPGIAEHRMAVSVIADGVAGHAIGNHTYSHPMFCNPRLGFPPRRWIERELRLAQETIGEHTGVLPVWFRAPYGVRWFGLRAALQSLQL